MLVVVCFVKKSRFQTHDLTTIFCFSDSDVFKGQGRIEIVPGLPDDQLLRERDCPWSRRARGCFESTEQKQQGVLRCEAALTHCARCYGKVHQPINLSPEFAIGKPFF